MSRAHEPTHPSQVDTSGAGLDHLGLTIREHFAAMAMQGLLACGKFADVMATDADFQKLAMEAVARRAVYGADALIAQLAKGRK